jgi:hypothetical protein
MESQMKPQSQIRPLSEEALDAVAGGYKNIQNDAVLAFVNGFLNTAPDCAVQSFYRAVA